jgi:hypothetical protein
MSPRCDKCNKKFHSYGGLAFSPPKTLADGTAGKKVKKFHICPKCWGLFFEWLKFSIQKSS